MKASSLSVLILHCITQSAFLGKGESIDTRNVREGSANGETLQKNKEKYFKFSSAEKFCEMTAAEDCKKRLCRWGYEEQCKNEERVSRYSRPICKDESSYRFFRSNEERIDAFWNENDFGYVRKVNKLLPLCEPIGEGDSSFACNSELTFCRGKHVYMDFIWNGRSIFERAENRPFNSGQFGGACKYIPKRFSHPDVHWGKLRSWVSQLDGFESLQFKPSMDENCDVTVSKPTVIMDLDFVGNMYHHFCDFFNLYITMHANGSWSKDVQIVTWDTRPQGRLGPFKDTWKAFTNAEVNSLWHKYNGKKVCFNDVVFSLLPRMAYGMYYSTPVVPGCSRSGLFHAFSKHIVKNLNISQDRKSKNEPLRITLLSRSTQWRRIVNEDELVASMEANQDIKVKVVDFNTDMPFLEQLKISHNSDVFIGIHGAGLAHTLFLPDWALLFELYNTEDINCYKDLARLRGVSYITWEDKNKLKDETENPHPQYNYEKFRNFRFDVKEFERLFGIALNQVRKNLEEFLGN